MVINVSSEIVQEPITKYTSEVKKVLNRTITNETLQRLQTIKPDNIFIDEFVNNLLDYYIGSNCQHEHQCFYLKLCLKDNGCIDAERCFQVIRDAHFGKGNPDIVVVCEDCLKMKRRFK